MNIKGKNVLIRAIEMDDAPLLLDMINDPETENMLGGYSFPVSEHQQVAWINSLTSDPRTFRGMIEVEGKAIGTVILTDIDHKNGTAEFHIKLGTGNVRGKGYGVDTCKAIIKYAFKELRLNCVHSTVRADNIPSQKMLLKSGFIKEAVLRQRLYKKGEYLDVISFSILAGECEDL